MSHPVLATIAPGPLTTVQDGGRVGVQRFGVVRGGAMDLFALGAANLLVGNSPGAPALEITLGGLVVEAIAPLLVAVAGAELPIERDGTPLPTWTALLLRAGQRLALGMRRAGARAYLALAGGIAVPTLLGGAGTDLGGGFGGLEGRALRAGDLLHGTVAPLPVERAGRWLPPVRRPPYGPAPTLHFIPGPHSDAFAPGALAAFGSAPYTLTADSNRMGYRLAGPHLPHAHGAAVRSLGVVPGVIQVPSGGQPIVLMADAQTTGGYPIIGTVISADLPLAAQLLPGDTVAFAATTIPQARAALIAQRRLLLLPMADDNSGGPV